MANIVLKTFAAGDEGQGTVTPQDDALIYQNAVSVNGIFDGATVTLTGANILHVASGFGIICGRFFEINESDISVQLSSSGTLNGRLKIHLDLNNADNPIEIVTETGASLPALSGDSNININGGAFDMELCTFSVNELTISSLVNTFPTIDNTSKQVRRKTAYAVNDFVLCQSASDALIFICTTAGTTAIQEPKAYQTVTDGNTVTDGTAIFKAVSVSGQITKLSKTEDLIAYLQALTKMLTASGASRANSFIYEYDLGTSFTNEQSADIVAGTFEKVRTGGYWTINGHKYWAAHADYRLHCGDTELTKHHMLVFPDKSFYTHYMNSTDVTTGAYYGSNMVSDGLTQALAIVKADFGESHVLTYRNMLANAVSGDSSSGWAWYDRQIDLMNECMVYGHQVWGHSGYDVGCDKSQLALFQARPDLIVNHEAWGWWLRDVQSSMGFCLANRDGGALSWGASNAIGVRPAFLIA